MMRHNIGHSIDNPWSGYVLGIQKSLFFFYFSGFGMANDNKHVKMKIVDDKLKIIDDVPTSAVEMAVKEKVCKNITIWRFFLL